MFFVLLFAMMAGCGDRDNQKKPPSPNTGSEAVKTDKAEWSAGEYEEKGMEYAMAVQRVLGKTLQEKIQDAIVFCKDEALPITDSLARERGVRISRITDKPRNPVNLAGAEEMKFISNFRAELSGGQTPEPLVVRQGEHTNFYYPILTNNMCLKCHGTPGDDIRPNVLSTLEELYAEDLATGYSVNELRGLWKVSFTED